MCLHYVASDSMCCKIFLSYESQNHILTPRHQHTIIVTATYSYSRRINPYSLFLISYLFALLYLLDVQVPWVINVCAPSTMIQIRHALSQTIKVTLTLIPLRIINNSQNYFIMFLILFATSPIIAMNLIFYL